MQWGVSSYVLLRATFGGEICCLCGIDRGGVWRAHIPVLPPRDQAELDFHCRQDACCSRADGSISSCGRNPWAEGEGKPSRDCVGEEEPVLWKAACRHGLHSSPLPFSVSQQQPQALWRPWWCCDKQSIHFLLSFTGLSGIKEQQIQTTA